MDLVSKQIAHIVSCIVEAGLDPVAQILGYLETGDDIYITRKGGARELITQVDRTDLEEFVRRNQE